MSTRLVDIGLKDREGKEGRKVETRDNDKQQRRNGLHLIDLQQIIRAMGDHLGEIDSEWAL